MVCKRVPARAALGEVTVTRRLVEGVRSSIVYRLTRGRRGPSFHAVVSRVWSAVIEVSEMVVFILGFENILFLAGSVEPVVEGECIF